MQAEYNITITRLQLFEFLVRYGEQVDNIFTDDRFIPLIN